MDEKTLEQIRAEKADPRYTELPMPCMHCKNIISVGDQFGKEGWTCKAFPAGIPYGVLAGHTPHKEVWDAQSGDMVKFDPVIYTEKDTGKQWHYTATQGWEYVE